MVFFFYQTLSLDEDDIETMNSNLTTEVREDAKKNGGQRSSQRVNIQANTSSYVEEKMKKRNQTKRED